MSIYGNRVKLSVSGARGGRFMTLTLSGLPVGEAIDVRSAFHRAINAKTEDEQNATEVPAVTGGLCEGLTEDGNLSLLIRLPVEAEVISSAPRPGYDDYARYMHNGDRDFSGGGYNGRFNLALATGGAICAQILQSRGIEIHTQVIRIGEASGNVEDFDMKRCLLDARGTGDGVGSILQCEIHGLKAGLRPSDLSGLDSRIASLVFSIAGVKGIDFGCGFDFVSMRSSTANDQLIVKGNNIALQSNNSGGIDSGITNGQPVSFRVVFRPTPGTGKQQHSVDIDTGTEVAMRQRGRHEPCLAIGSATAVAGVAALCVLETVL